MTQVVHPKLHIEHMPLTRRSAAPLAARGRSPAAPSLHAVWSAAGGPASTRRAQLAAAAARRYSAAASTILQCSPPPPVASSTARQVYSGCRGGVSNWSLGIRPLQQRRDRLICIPASAPHPAAVSAAAAATAPAAPPAGATVAAGMGSRRRMTPGRRHTVAAAAAPAAAPPPPQGPASAAGDDGGDDDDEDDGVAAVELYLGPAVDLVSALDALSFTSTFAQMCVFLENNSQLFRGPEVAAVVLQAATVSELSAQRQMAAAMAVAERQSAAMEAAGDEQQGTLSPEALAGAVDSVLRAAGPNPLGSAGGGGSTADDDDSVLDELDAADQLLNWATPLVRAHIKRYPPDAILALLSALAQLQQYDQRLMELAAETFKSDPRVWLRRAAPPSSAALAGGETTAFGGYGEAVDGEGAADGGDTDPWVALVSLANAFARLGHYDRALMAAIAQQAVELMPEVWDRAEAEDVAAADVAEGGGEPSAAASGGGGGGGGGVTSTVVSLVSAFLELSHLDPPLMQAVGEHLASFSHQLERDAVAEALLSFATFNARNPAFYSLLLRRLVEPDGAQWGPAVGTLSPRGAGALYRACVLISAMGDVPELSPLPAPPAPAALSGSGPAAPQSAATQEAHRVGVGLSRLLRGCLAAFPLSGLQAAPLGRPSPEQLQAAGAAEDLEVLQAWADVGLLTVPQILSTLQQLPVEPLSPAALTAGWAAAPQVYVNAGDAVHGGAADYGDDGLIVGGADAVAWVPPDALLLYDGPDGSGSASGSGFRIAVKALDEAMHCCRNIGLDLDLDLEPDQPGQRSGLSSSSSSTSASASPSSEAQPWWRRRRQLRLRGPALSELRCLGAWGWRVVVVPVGLWGAMDPGDRRTWLVRQLDELASEGHESSAALGPELLV
ncbi:hypothetical protein PLESTB_000619300 [Pleodorina starrii]|uniref:Uncharacterized protein n=1 Tax=Pleodorina starrii TaxID=330485 RepID=A0A9W6BHK3_9CHLO|nr:hypothetical protein PLESTM_001733600 [Pleodorina starrii]GLC52346.1 hypothetical protein PLESTB_000619300 [Pleodorina starrii]GLC67986.1 hypothetical protein PLESTF_000631000 [Pleodorina starrii]